VLQRISSLTRLCGVGNQFADEFVHPWISSLRSLCFTDQFADESVLWPSVPWRVCASGNQFADWSMF
jgi:hypothetical protein